MDLFVSILAGIVAIAFFTGALALFFAVIFWLVKKIVRNAIKPRARHDMYEAGTEPRGWPGGMGH